MPKYIIFIVLSILLLLPPALNAEARAVWVLPWGINTPQKVSTLVEDAVATGQTDLFLEVRYRADALYRPNRKPDKFHNPEYRSHILNGQSFDPLEQVLQEAQPHGIKVHAWIVVLNATPVDPTLMAKNYIYGNHRDWITFDRNLTRPSASANAGHFIDPGIPEVQQHILNVVGDLLSGYPELDGLHLDYIRYPNSSLGYHPISTSRFNSHKETNPIQWNQWRILQVTSLVEKIRELSRSINPNLAFSAAVMPDPKAAATWYAQDWQDWLERDLVDFVCPMNYPTVMNKFRENSSAAEAIGFNHRIWMGLRAYNENGASLAVKPNSRNFNILDVATRVEDTRARNFAGIVLFSYDDLIKDGALAQLCSSIYAEPGLVVTLPELEFKEEEIKFAADLGVWREGNRYSLITQVPFEGIWTLEILGLEDRVLHRNRRVYLKGQNQEYWNGTLEDGTLIEPGDYFIRFFRHEDSFEYLIPATFPRLEP